MNLAVVIEPEAERELRAARDWYEERREGLGGEFLGSVEDAVRRIAALPTASTPVPGVSPDLGVRRVQLKRFPYAVVFIELDDQISVVAFAHARRRPGYWTRRLRGTQR